MKLNVMAFSLACGLFWAASILLLTWWSIVFDGASSAVTFLGKYYLGYTITPIGSLIGLIWAFFDGIISGAIFAWLYNFLTSKFTAKK